ncbi:KIF-binding protein-like [Dreissena polymorpha]|uniref:KIF-binding protein n=1 Tax=Dreissena polymorpha TaxID=45954 RepID=A0A9D4LAJ5_DREPO|nr:KIF-binding protein-like [Dreissena polymorpha]KAH3855037.1 hypothetical protein DPMN_097597 [Dreissena polymorpha]
MAAWKEFLTNEGFEKLKEARHFADELAKDDPDEEPYRSLYKARDLLNSVKKVLKKTADKRHWDADFYFVWCALELKLGTIYIATEEKATGEEHLLGCLEKLEDFKLTKEGMGIYQDTLNQMGILWSGRGKPEEALDYFKQAELIYVDFKSIVGGAPFMIDEFLTAPSEEDSDKREAERKVKFESAYTHTLFYFAQVYQQLGDAEISAQYCNLTLQRQLDSQSLDRLDWSLHAATLSQYYMTQRDFNMSRHCLASAEVVFQQEEANDVTNCPDEVKEKMQQAKADIIRCWIKYALGLMDYSREQLLQEAAGNGEEEANDYKADGRDSDKESEAIGVQQASDAHSVHSNGKVDESEDTSREENDPIIADESVEQNETEQTSQEIKSTANENDQTSTENTGEDKKYVVTDNTSQHEQVVLDKENDEEKKQLEREAISKRSELLRKEAMKKDGKKFNLEVTSHEEKITDKPLKTFDEAREIFLIIKKWIEQAKEFYKLDHHCPDYVAIVQDHSLSFKFLSFFELDMERQCKMQKRRIDMLSEILNELNPQHYLLVSRQLMFEIADTYSTLMDLKMAILEAAGEGVRPTPHHVKKINLLVKESIKYYQEYLNTLKGGKPVYPDEFPNNDVRPGLVAMFCMGRLYSKYIPGDVQTRLMNIKKSKDCYQFVVDYCNRNRSAKALVEGEYQICKEMVDLLPAKMEKIRLEAET